MDLGSIMTRKVVTVEMDDSIRLINGIFAHVKFHHLLVVDKGRLVGVISDRDVLKAMSPFVHTLAEQARDAATLERKAHQIMSRNLVTGSSDMSIVEGVGLMLENRVSCLPIVSREGAIEGVVTWKDMLNAFVETDDVLCNVCRMRLKTRKKYGSASDEDNRENPGEEQS
ncbi:MAG: CBS domain-containing protein [Syntrophotaleaceae bacterium]